MKGDMNKQECTPGVYLIIGAKGVRIGRSGCMKAVYKIVFGK